MTLVAAVNQPVFLALLLMPLLMGTRKEWIWSGVTCGLAGATYLTEKAADPTLWREFQQTVVRHLAASHDYGEGVFGIVVRGVGVAWLAMGLQVVFSVGTVVFLFSARGRQVAGDHVWLACVALAVVLVNPRIMPYDSAVGLIPAMAILMGARRSRGFWVGMVGVVLACAVGHRVLGFTPLLMAGFLVGARQLVLPDEPAARGAVTSALRAVLGFAWPSRWSA